MTLSIFDIIQIITAIVSSIYFYKYKNSFLKYICYFLWYTIANEFLGNYIGEILEKDTGYLYNIRRIVLFTLIYWILKNAIKDKKRLKIINILFFIYALIQGIEIVYKYKTIIVDYYTISYFIGGLISFLGIMYYAIELLKSQNITFLHKNLTVWFLIGNLIFWIVYLPINLIFTNYEYFSKEVLDNLSVIHNTFIIIQNIIFILGFIISERIDET
ncbi:hypothetical protein [uncultured Dokdonia sp.]|uniref:hypothetical protein n=1 Tax=uncultured Dokdonia sp. TaxID=575653 RepID=UPI0026312132|nr:hypothetical protein [uncultured Dokdonia sp.]